MKRKCESNTFTLSRREMNSVEAVGQEEVRTPGLVRTLIADDDPFGLKTLALMLALEARFDLVGTASDGRQAVRKAFELRPELVLLDHRMPGLDGIQAIRCIKGLKHPPLVVLVTSDNTPDCRARAKAAGADGFVDKGGDLQGQLHGTFHELLGAWLEQSKPL